MSEERWGGARAARGGLLLQLAIQLGSVATTLILARLLMPEEFGVVALANSVLALAALLSAGGVGPALMRAKESVDRRAHTYFWTNFGIASVLAALVAALSKPLGVVLGQGDAWVFILALCPTLPITALSSIPQSLLFRQERFGTVYRANALQSGSYFLLQIVLALGGLGAWSIIIAQVVSGVAAALYSTVKAAWVPRPVFDRALLKQDFGFLTGTSISQLLMYVIRNCDYWFVSRHLGASALGVYYMAYVLPNILRQRVSWAISSVLFVHMVKAGDDQRQRTMLWSKVWALQCGLGLPALVGLAIVSRPVVELLFGTQWDQAVGPLRWTCAIAFVDLHMVIVTSLATARGLVSATVKVLTVRAVACVVAVAVAVPVVGTIEAAAAAILLGSLITVVVQDRVLAPQLGVGLGLVFPNFLRFAVCTIAMVGVVTLLHHLLPDVRSLPYLLLAGTVGAVSYFAVGFVLFRPTFRALLEDVLRLAKGS